MNHPQIFIVLLCAVGGLLLYQARLVRSQTDDGDKTTATNTANPGQYVTVELTANITALNFRPFEIVCELQNFTLPLDDWQIWVTFYNFKVDPGIILGGYSIRK